MRNPVPRQSQRRRFGWFALIPLLLLVLAACGSSSTATVPAPTATTAPTVAPVASAAASTAPASAAPSASATVAQASPRASQAASASAAPAAAASSGSTSASASRYTITTNSKATYEVKETFVGRGLATAVGTTTAIAGDLTIDKQNPAKSTIGTITVDISKLTSNENQRDNRIRNQWLESTKFPTATFVTKRLAGLPTTPYTDGQDLTFTIVGDLTIRNVTKEVTFDATGKLVGDTFTGTAKTQFNMTDFGFNPPEIAGLLKAENGVILTMTIEAKRAQ